MPSPTATARAMHAWPWPVALGNKERNKKIKKERKMKS